MINICEICCDKKSTLWKLTVKPYQPVLYLHLHTRLSATTLKFEALLKKKRKISLPFGDMRQ